MSEETKRARELLNNIYEKYGNEIISMVARQREEYIKTTNELIQKYLQEFFQSVQKIDKFLESLE